MPVDLPRVDALDSESPPRKRIPKELTAHGTTPSGKPRLFVCTTCTRAFARLEHLRRHERSHTKEKPFTCSVCQRKFSRRDLLLRHAQKLHAGCADAVSRLRRKLRADASVEPEEPLQEPEHEPEPEIHFNLASFDERRDLKRRMSLRGRGASFSAQSGGNYANAEAYAPDSVEFSTPQLLPTGDDSWLGSLSTIPGMEKRERNGEGLLREGGLLRDISLLRDRSMSRDGSMARDGNIVRDGSINGEALARDTMRSDRYDMIMRSDSVASAASFGSNDAAPPFSMNQNRGFDEPDFGYSFYDVPDTGHFAKSTRPLSPIRQEDEDGDLTCDPTNMLLPATVTEGVSFDLDFLNDIDELTQDFDVGSKFLPNGYSFYGDSVSVSSDSMLPSQLGRVASQPGYNRTRLFTKNMRLLINKALSKYPISGIMTPTIPSNEKLEFFLVNFNNVFLAHFPFIHPSKLNEYEMMRMTAGELSSTESAVVCLPLLVATIGALMANNKNDSEHLYEASRRTIHIYLENRKNTVSDQSGHTLAVNPLWLIQSLTLSVIYGLFSDNENNVYIVIRQLNALNSLVKTSIKSNRTTLFSVNEETGSSPGELRAAHQDAKFKSYINNQSQIRIVFMIYKLTNFLLMMYNVPLTLSVNDFGSLTCPNIYDEFLWNFSSYKDFDDYSHSVGSKNDLDFYLNHSESDKILFKEVLFKLSKSEFDPSLVTHISTLSKYGFSSLVHGIFEIKQYEEMKNIDVFSILDNLTLFIDNSRNNSEVCSFASYSGDYQKLDYVLLVNFTKICAVIDFKLVKEQSWLRNYEELTKNYYNFLKSMEQIEDYQYMRVIDCCIVVMKLLLFKTERSENFETNPDRPVLFENELLFLSKSGPNEFNNMLTSSLQHQFNTSANFEKLVNWKVYDEVDFSKNSIHSQMLFHVFIILSIFAIQIAKRNQSELRTTRDNPTSDIKQLNQRYILVLQLLSKVEGFLQESFRNTKSEQEIANLYLYSSFKSEDVFANHRTNHGGNEADINGLLGNHNYFAHSLEKSLYILKIGELMLRHLYESNIKICIFKKLSESLSQVRKFLIDDETRILAL